MVFSIAVAQPEITVRGEGFEISDGQNTWPDSTGQAFGVLTANQDAVDHTFWIFNEGTSDLNVSDINVRSTTYDDHFSIVGSTALTITAGDSASFIIRYRPIGTGTHGRRDASPWRNWIDIISDDADEATFNFSISGAAIQEDGFDCSSGRMLFSHYSGNGTDLKEWNYGEQPPTLNTISNAWTGYHDGMSLNPSDNYIYAMRYHPSNTREQLWAFDQSGNSRYVADVVGGNITASMGAHASAGAFDNNNNLYTFHNADATTSLNKINVRSAEAELITLTDPVHIRAAIYNPDEGLLYGYSFGATHNGLVSVNPNDGTVTYIGGDGDGTYHAMFRSTDGSVYMMSKTYSMYLVDLTDGSLELIGTNPGWGDGIWVDGCACGEIKAEADVNLTLDDNRPSYVPGQIQTYTITIKNNGPWGSYRDTVRNALPSGITEMTWTSTTYGTAVSDNANGTGALEDVIDLSVGDSVVYIVKVTVPLGFTGDLDNIASVTASTVVADPDMANNSVTDTDIIFSLATEQCNNGFDDDGDGDVDCFDGDCAGTSVCASHYTNGVIPDCPDTPDVALFSMKQQWTSTAGEAYITPVVGDMDGDGIPEIVTVNYGNGRIYVLNGQDGSTITNIAYQGTYHNFSGGAAIADIDNDGTAEVFLVTGNAQGGVDNNNCRQWISCFDYDNGALTQRYRELFGRINLSEYSDQKWAVVQFADFDEDGVPELFIGNHVMNSATGAIIASPTTVERNSLPRGRQPGYTAGDYMSAAYDVLPDAACPNCDGLELICGNTVYAVDLTDPGNDQNGITEVTRMDPTETYTDGFTSLADWDGDGQMDIVVVGYRSGNARFYIWDPRADTVIIDETIIPNSNINPAPGRVDRGAGRATVADFDGDGVNELAIVSRHRLNLYEHDGSLKWFESGSDHSQKTSATAFDFEGDGNMEVIYRDEQNLKILDGVTGNVKDVLGCTSGTRVEMPVIADVDGDGEAEICVSCGSNTRVYTSDLTPWMPTRKVWNSLHYSPTFINDDLTIPAQRQNKATVPRNDIYAAQTFITDPSGNIVYPALPDFEINIDSTVIADCEDDSMLVYVTVCNDDAAALIYDYPVSFYDGDPTTGGTLLLTRTVTVSNSTPSKDSCYQFSFNVPHMPTNLFVFANDSGTGEFGYPTTLIEECDSSNNSANAQVGCPYDAGITKDDGELHYIPGGVRTYEIVARNNGPSFIDGIVSDPLPVGVGDGDVTWTATTYGGATTTASGTMNGALQDTVDIPGGDSIVYSVTIVTPDSLVGDLVNIVSISVTGDTITDNNTATDTDTVDCTFAIEGTINSRTNSWVYVGTVVGGFEYNFSSTGGSRTFTATNGPENGQTVTTVRYNNTTNDRVSLGGYRYTNGNVQFGSSTGFDNTPHGWTGLDGKNDASGDERAPVLGFMAFIDQNGNGSFDSGDEEFINDIRSLSVSTTTSGELYMAFYDDGNYSDNNGLMTISSSITPPTVSLGIDLTICSGDSLQLDAGNPGALSWVWSNGETTQTIQAKTAGEYSVVVTTVGGCQTVDTMDLDLVSVTVDLGNDTSLCFGDSVMIDAGNPDAVEWDWNSGDTTQSFYVSTTGQFIVEVTDTNGCTNGADTINVTVNALPVVDLGNDTAVCVGDSITFGGPTGGSSVWNIGEKTDSITVGSAGIYVLVNTDANNCVDSDSVVLTINALPVVDLGNDTTICPDSSLTLNAIGGSEWDWSTNESTPSIETDTAGIYSVKIKDSNGCLNTDTINVSIASASEVDLGADTSICFGEFLLLSLDPGGEEYAWNTLDTTRSVKVFESKSIIASVTYPGGCLYSDTIEVSVDPLPEVSLGNDTAICTGDTIILDSGDGIKWEWNTGGVDSTVSVEAGTYSVLVTDTNGCIGSDEITISNHLVNTIGLGKDTSFCIGDTITLDAGNGDGWEWSTTAITQGIEVSDAGTYWVAKTDSNDCETRDTIVVVSEDLPVVDLGPSDTTICVENEYVLDPGNEGLEIVWNNSDTGRLKLVNGAGVYKVTVTNDARCSAYDSITINFYDVPEIEISSKDTSMCLGYSVDITVGDFYTSYAWTNSSSISNTITVDESNTYEVTIIDTNGCEGSESVDVTVLPLPEIGLESTENFCAYSEGLILTVNTSGADYLWSNGEETRSITIDSPGSYWVDVKDINDCFNSDTVEVVEAFLNVSLGEDISVCGVETVTVDAGDYALEIWNGNDTSSVYVLSESDSVEVVAIDAEGCYGKDTIHVVFNQNPIIVLEHQDSAICDLIGEKTVISIVDPQDNEILWSTEEASTSIDIVEAGTYSVTLTNEADCSTSDSVEIARSCDIPPFTLPNIFTPTDDGINEEFTPIEDPDDILTYYRFIKFIVYNRWGKAVFLSENAYPNWDGRFIATGEFCSSGAYFYVIEYEDINSQLKVYNGFVELMR
tara:strand:+ start:756 stop:7997 length:7242 start_codon:yes stop_codon:yes gene_type:complete